MVKQSSPIVSVIITAHAEGILTHRTLSSVRYAIAELARRDDAEIILHLDNPTSATSEYIETNKQTLKDVRIFINHFGDLGASRNFAIQQSVGEYVATIDADDIMSRRWLVDAIALLKSQQKTTIAHSEYTVEFEGVDSLVVKHGEIDYDTDTLLSVFSNRWNSVIVAPRELLVNNPYTPNSSGFGYEDWNLNCRLIHSRVQNLLVPETAIFVRRKQTNSEWARQIQSMSVLRANPLLAFDNIRTISDPFRRAPSQKELATNYRILARTKTFIKKNPTTHRIARYIKRSIKRRDITPKINGSHVPQWLRKEWLSLHRIERQIFPTKHLMESIPVYDTITEDHKLAGSLYKALVDQLQFNTYTYVIFVPWLTKGGADKYAIEYANTISSITGTHVLIVSTLPVQSPWKDQLSDMVSFLDFGNTTLNASKEIRQRLMEHIIENSKAKVLHVINSEFGYDFIQLHENYIKSSGKKVVVTSFSQSIEPVTGHTYGYSHTHVPFVYNIADIITSDNQAVIDMWTSEYGFNPNKLVVHHQSVPLPANVPARASSPRAPAKILWAGRISPEKLPDVAVAIGEGLQGVATIDMYGVKEPGFDTLLSSLPDNVTYKGPYDGFASLDTAQYDILLYTSLFDGMPNVILEAAAVGLPIVASGVGGIPEFIDTKSGIIITDIYDIQSYTSAINNILNDGLGESYALEAYKKLGAAYSREQYAKSITEMLQTLGLIN